jgi:hypothetical protein
MTIRSFRVTKDKAAVSLATQETAFNAGATLSHSLLITEGDIPADTFVREKNEGELTGKEEADRIYYRGKTADMNWTFDKATPTQILLPVAYALGDITTVAAGTGYQHTIVPFEGDVDNRRSLPSFSTGFRFSDQNDAKYDGCVVDSVTLTFTKGEQAEFLKASATLKNSGKRTDSTIRETVNAALNATSLALTDGVNGDDAAGRLRNVQTIDYTHTDGYLAPVVYSAVSDDTAGGVITIEAPGAVADTVDYRVVYTTHDGPITFPALVTETPLKTSGAFITFGGMWNGSSFVGGRTLACEAKNIEWTYTNGVALESCFGEDADYAGRVWRDARTQTLKVDRELRDWLYQTMLDQEEYFGLHILAEGAVYDDPHKFTVELIFPRLAVMTNPVSADGKRLSESIELSVLQDTTYGSVIARIKNTVPTVAG